MIRAFSFGEVEATADPPITPDSEPPRPESQGLVKVHP